MNNEQIGKYKDLGWEFKRDQWISHHNGDIDDELLVKSPRLTEFFCVASSRHSIPDWKDVDEKEMLKLEAKKYADQFWGEYKYDFGDLVKEAIKENKNSLTIDFGKL